MHEAAGDPKYIICNGDEGDPGAFMDRMILESYPYRVIEGMLIASVAVGAEKGLFYIRAEYPLAVRRVEEAIRFCEEAGYLGDDILGSGHSLHLHVMKAAGAFVCGEETALMASVEGRRGFPSHRPPYPSASGLYGFPPPRNHTAPCSPMWGPAATRHNSNDQIILEPKEHIEARLGFSPDAADAAALTFAFPVGDFDEENWGKTQEDWGNYEPNPESGY